MEDAWELRRDRISLLDRPAFRRSLKKSGVRVDDSEVGRVIDPEEEADRSSVPTDWQPSGAPYTPGTSSRASRHPIDSRERDLRVTCTSEQPTAERSTKSRWGIRNSARIHSGENPPSGSRRRHKKTPLIHAWFARGYAHFRPFEDSSAPRLIRFSNRDEARGRYQPANVDRIARNFPKLSICYWWLIASNMHRAWAAVRRWWRRLGSQRRSGSNFSKDRAPMAIARRRIRVFRSIYRVSCTASRLIDTSVRHGGFLVRNASRRRSVDIRGTLYVRTRCTLLRHMMESRIPQADDVSSTNGVLRSRSISGFSLLC